MPAFANDMIPAFIINQIESEDIGRAVAATMHHVLRSTIGVQFSNPLYDHTGLSVLRKKLDGFLDQYEGLVGAVADAKAFISSMPRDIVVPNVWTDGSDEIAFEWAFKSKRAFVTFEGDGEYGYTMKIGEKFVPGKTLGHLGTFPSDLLAYLSDKK